MRVLIVGASGTIGSAVAEACRQAGHEVLAASRSAKLKVDIVDLKSIKALYGEVGKVQAVISCAGGGVMAPLGDLTDQQIYNTLGDKLMGQVNLVRAGIASVEDGGVFILTAGIFGQTPPPGVPAIAMANGALESFARAAAHDLPRGIRIGTISPPFITETAKQMGMPTQGTLSAKDNARAYVDFLTGAGTGQVIYPGGTPG